MTFFITLSFVAGVLTVLAPCVLPLLPIIVGETLAGKFSSKRALTTILSLGASLFVFTLLLKVSTAFISVPLSVWTGISGGLLIAFGLVTFFPNLWYALPFVNTWSRNANKTMNEGLNAGSVWGDVVAGVALGPVFSSCSPTYFLILATVLPVSFGLGLFYLSVYIIGLCLSLLAIALLGQRLVGRLGIASDPNGRFKRGIGALFVLIGLLVLTGADKTVESYVLSHTSRFDVTRIEQFLLKQHSGGMEGAVPEEHMMLTPEQKAGVYQKAPELVHPDAYLNTDGQSVSIGQYKGKKVVLIDFWTYSCINCQRTIPYLNQWYQKYKDQGLIIIGVHTPEFSFEHDKDNVAAALKQFGIRYPVALDNEYQTWNAFSNQFWPREYLVDVDGYIVHDHAGEGEYDQTEAAIQAALKELAARTGESTGMVATGTVSVPAVSLDAVGSPETYFGSARNEYFGNGTPGFSGVASYALPATLRPNAFYLSGTWRTEPERAVSTGAGAITYRYTAHDLYFVASADVPVTVTVLRDGVPVGNAAGSDVDAKKSTLTIHEHRLYRLVHDSTPGTHTIELRISGAGLSAYTFTFG